MPAPDSSPFLAPGTALDDYRIKRPLGGGGFSLVYLARHRGGGVVALKEYLPSRVARRASDGVYVEPIDDDAAAMAFNLGLRLFVEEAAALAPLDNPHIVRVNGFFRANGTAYMAMVYEEGVNLESCIRRYDRGLSENLLKAVFPPLLDGLGYVHTRGVLHLDIKPANIHLRPGGRPLLLDFGAVRRRFQDRGLPMPKVTTPGFAAPEQLVQEAAVGPWTDLYGLGATLWACMAGQAPPPADQRTPARDRKVAFRRNYHPALVETVQWATELETDRRPQSAAALSDVLARLPDDDEPSLLSRLGARWRGGGEAQ